MLSKNDATAIMTKLLAEYEASAGVELAILQATERPDSWVFLFGSKLHQETGDARHAVAGNGPVVISKRSGGHVNGPTWCSVEKSVAIAEAALLAQDLAGTKGAG